MHVLIRSLLRMAIATCFFAIAAILAGCPDPPAPPPAFEACGTVNIRIRGRMGIGSMAPRNVSTTATLDEDSTSVSWTTAGSGTGTVLDGVSASGATMHNPQTDERAFAATGTSGSHTLDVTGTIKADCTGSGQWKVTITDNGQLTGRGNWTIQ